MSRKRILLTGACGCVGSDIMKYLSNKGYVVIGTYRNTMPINLEYEMIHLDLLSDHLNLKNIDVVVHIAAALNGNCIKMIEDNILATKNLLHFAEQHEVEKFIYISSVSVHGSTYKSETILDKILSEESGIFNPDIYGITKYLSEMLVKESKIKEKFALRLPRMLGESTNLDAEGSGFLSMFKNILFENDINCYISEVYYNNFLHTFDLSIFLDSLLSRGFEGFDYALLASPKELKMKEILNIFRREVNSKSKINYVKSDALPKCNLIDIGKAQSMGFNPMKGEEIIKRFAKDVLKKYKIFR